MASAVVPGAVSPPDLREVELSIRGMTCAACAARVEKKLGALRDVAASVNFATEKATVTAPFSVSVDVLIEAVEQAGYGAQLARPHPAEGLPAARRRRAGCGQGRLSAAPADRGTGVLRAAE